VSIIVDTKVSFNQSEDKNGPYIFHIVVECGVFCCSDGGDKY